MSEKERAAALLDMVPDYKLGYVVAYMQGLIAETEAADDAFCDALYEEYKADPDKGNVVSLEDAAAMLGVSL